jgi:hypothetical protein
VGVVVDGDDGGAIEACLEDAVRRLEFPRPRAEGRTWTKVPAPRPPEGDPDAEGAACLATYSSEPALLDRGCVGRNVVVPERWAGLMARAEVQMVVEADGRASRFRATGEQRLSDDLAAAVKAAVDRCGFIPARDLEGRPVRAWVVIPIRFE